LDGAIPGIAVRMPDAQPGSIVADPSGRRYARLDEVFAGRTSGRPEFGILSLDEAGTERVAVPLAGARQEGEAVVLPLDVDRVVAAPRVQGEVEEIPAEAGRLILAHFGMDAATTSVMPAEPGPPATPPRHDPGPDDEAEVVLSEEQLAVETRSVPTERVRVRKAVVTEDVSMTVTVRREELIVERAPIKGGEPPADELAIGEGSDVEFVLHAEEPVVTKRVVPVERVRVRRNEIVEEQRITDTVRKERVEVDQNPTTPEDTTR
jgi:uncharacterized protein (TIGR02271 family)